MLEFGQPDEGDDGDGDAYTNFLELSFFNMRTLRLIHHLGLNVAEMMYNGLKILNFEAF
jgi:hypothetical protein